MLKNECDNKWKSFGWKVNTKIILQKKEETIHLCLYYKQITANYYESLWILF